MEKHNFTSVALLLRDIVGIGSAPQLLTFLTKKGIVDAKAQMISGHKYPGSMAIYKELNLSDIAQEYWDAMDDFPIH
jgi:hypothetical protein